MKYRITLLLVIAGVFCSYKVFSQEGYYRYWVELKNKDTIYSISRPIEFLSQKALDRRKRQRIEIQNNDIPVNSRDVESIRRIGFKILHTSKWLNAVTVQCIKKSLSDSLLKLPCVKSVSYLGILKYTDEENSTDQPLDLNEALSLLESKFQDIKKVSLDSSYFGKSTAALKMINLDKLKMQGLDGKGVSIAILDAGFKGANKMSVFRHAFDSGHVIGSKDFVELNNNVFDDDDHGVGVWSCIAALKPYELIGSAPQADFWLLRTEYAPTEAPIEETHWLAAAEFADSAGVDIISSSVGYNEFDDKTLNHQLMDLDGKTTIISKAASIAASKGILVVNSAGNEGENDWKSIVAPADAANILTVGGVDLKGNYSGFSSIGPSYDKRIKPDVVALGEDVWVPSTAGTLFMTRGTSYACPLITGSVATLMQSNHDKTNAEIISAIKLSGSQYYAPDKFVGSGIPDIVLANKILGGDKDYPTKKDILLDARILKDGKLHLTINSRTLQKIKFEMEDTKIQHGFSVISGTADIKSTGVSRYAIQLKLKTLVKGTYAVYLHAHDGASSFVIKID